MNRRDLARTGAAAVGLLACSETGLPPKPPPDYSAVAGYYYLNLLNGHPYAYCAGDNNSVACESAQLRVTMDGAYTSLNIHTFADFNTGFEFHDTTVFQGHLDLLTDCDVHIDAPAEPNGPGRRHAYDLTFTAEDTVLPQRVWTYTAADSSISC